MYPIYNLNSPPADLDHSRTLYIGRGSFWGNPYRIGQDGMDRRSVVEAYRQRLWNSFKAKGPAYQKILNGELNDKFLGCYCYPQLCHGHVLIRANHYAMNNLNHNVKL